MEHLQKLKSQDEETLIANALLFAFNAHSGQYRKALPEQYIIHPLRVSEFLLKNFADHPNLDAMRIAAILHDTVEDTWVTEKEIETKFGKNISNLVAALTKPEHPDKNIRDDNYLLVLAEGSDEAKIIKLADIFDNVVLSTDDNERWKEFICDCETVLKHIELKESNQKFDKIKSELMQIINMKLKHND